MLDWIKDFLGLTEEPSVVDLLMADLRVLNPGLAIRVAAYVTTGERPQD